jgi:hypothetical protein
MTLFYKLSRDEIEILIRMGGGAKRLRDLGEFQGKNDEQMLDSIKHCYYTKKEDGKPTFWWIFEDKGS